MPKSKFSASSIVVQSIFVIHLVNGAQFFFNATCVSGTAATAISPLTKMLALLQLQRLDFKPSVL